MNPDEPGDTSPDDVSDHRDEPVVSHPREPDPPRDKLGPLPTSRQARAPNRRRVRATRPFRGAYVRPVPAGRDPRDLAWAATLRRAAPAQRSRQGNLALQVRPDELLRKLRMHRPRRLLLLLVDISGSMGGALMDLARRTAVGLLDQAYLDRDQVAMIAFCHRTAELLLAPTSHPEQVQRALVNLQCGGTTPLAAGLRLAHRTLQASSRRDEQGEPALLLISDGHANVGDRPGMMALEHELDRAAETLARIPRLRRLFLDTTPPGKHNHRARRLAGHLAAEHHLLWQLERSGIDPAEVLITALR